MKSKVLHLTTLHQGFDSRMVLKMAFTTALSYPTYVFAAGKTADHSQIHYLPIRTYSALWKRLLLVHPGVLFRSIRLRPDVVHVHAPEALPIALILYGLGAKVIFDVYENMGKQMQGKEVNNGRLFQTFFRFFDRIARKKFHFIFAEDSYLESYTDIQHTSAVIHNFPDLSTFPVLTSRVPEKSFFYLGQLSKARCLDVMIRASVLLKKDHPDFRWQIFGKPGFDIHSFEEIEQMEGFSEVKDHFIFHGFTPAPEAYQTGRNCLAGVALLRPIGDFPGSYPTKIFEYMALQLPVITSNFPLYQSVVETHSCGYCLVPDQVETLVHTLKTIIEQPKQAREMGMAGYQAVRTHYHWESEKMKLLELYKTVI